MAQAVVLGFPRRLFSYSCSPRTEGQGQPGNCHKTPGGWAGPDEPFKRRGQGRGGRKDSTRAMPLGDRWVSHGGRRRMNVEILGAQVGVVPSTELGDIPMEKSRRSGVHHRHSAGTAK